MNKKEIHRSKMDRSASVKRKPTEDDSKIDEPPTKKRRLEEKAEDTALQVTLAIVGSRCFCD
jgi:hypothetical protein